MKLQAVTTVLIRLIAACVVFYGLLILLGLLQYRWVFSSEVKFEFLDVAMRNALIQVVLASVICVALGIVAYRKSGALAEFVCKGVDENS